MNIQNGRGMGVIALQVLALKNQFLTLLLFKFLKHEYTILT